MEDNSRGGEVEYSSLPDCVEFDSMESLHALASAQRLSLIEALAEPRSASELAAFEGVPVTRLYYHLDTLLEHGLIQVVGQRPASRRPERVYQITGKSFRPSERFLETYGQEGIAAAAGLTFRHAETALAAALKADAVSLADAEGGPCGHVSLAMLRLSPARLKMLISELERLQEEFAADDGELPVNLFVSAHPRLQRGSSS